MPRPYPQKPADKPRKEGQYAVKLSDVDKLALELEAETRGLSIAETLRQLVRETLSYKRMVDRRNSTVVHQSKDKIESVLGA